ncbi:UNVERIFIED_CONTAM: NAD(P)-dependent dehydrogenase (short-subunit alcohol dehydrogenase family) [Paenibacillus sp. PvR008]
MDNFVPAAELTDELWERIFAINTTGPMCEFGNHFLFSLTKVPGSLLMLASLGGLQGSRAGAAYTAAKHAVVGLTKNVGFQYANKGVRCNALAPGAVITNIGTFY